MVVDASRDAARVSADERSVCEWIAGWGAEVAAADLRSGRIRFDPDLTAFGTHADVVKGRAEVEAQQWSHVWPAIEDFAFTIDQLVALVSPDRLMAVAIVPWTSTGIDEEGGRFDRPGRATVTPQRVTVDHAWIGTHTHLSLARGVPPRTYGSKNAII